ncbi:cutinase, partial [Aspergillus novoparasiticus]
MGVLVGPDLENALAHKLRESSLAVQGVAYPANLDGYLNGGDAEGANLLVTLVQRSLRQCPDSAVVLSGYSQGAQLIHRAARNLTVPETDMLKAM